MAYSVLEIHMTPEPKLIAYQVLTPDKNNDVFRVELYQVDSDLDGLRFYIALSGSHGFKVFVTDEEAAQFKQKENITLVPSEEDFIRRNE